jgi:tRNA A22 N-methylase
VVVAGMGGFLVMNGLKALKQTNPTPRETIQTLKEDAQWAKEQTR